MAAIEYPVERMQAAAAQINAAAEAMMQELTYRLQLAQSSAGSVNAGNLSGAYQEFLNIWGQHITALANTWQELAQHLTTAAEQMQAADTGLAQAVEGETAAVTPGQ